MRILVVGHLPPPVTGENLCRARLVEMLRTQGADVTDVRRKDFKSFFGCYDVVVLVNGESVAGSLFDFVATLWGLLFTQRVVWYFHNRSWLRFSRRHVAWALWGHSKRIVPIVLTNGIRTALAVNYPLATVLNNTPERIFEAHNPVGTGGAKRRLLWVGRPDSAKGFDIALGALDILRKHQASWIMDVYGLEASEAKSRGLDREGVIYHGFVSDEAKLKAFRTGGIFILPSRYRNETQPLSIIEALACGVPVVASAIGGIAEMLVDGERVAGQSLSEGEASAYVAAIEWVMTDYEARSRDARAIYESRFSRVRFGERVKELFA